MIYEITPGRVAVEYGPITMVITAKAGTKPFSPAAFAAGRKAMETLEQLAPFYQLAKKSFREIKVRNALPIVFREMLAAVQIVGDPTLTPMAAVAGAIADQTCQSAIEAGATTVIVNNGGDLAIRVTPGEELTIGLAEDIINKQCKYFLPVTVQTGIGGVCTSGLGGRSFTKGVATAAVAIAENAVLADAAATYLGNCTGTINHPNIVKVKAEEIDPASDLVGQLVTKEVGLLPDHLVEAALKAGEDAARELVAKGALLGWFLVVQEKENFWPATLIRKRYSK